MFTFHHKSTILDINRYDCLAFVNPADNDSDFFIDKIYADTTFPLNISLLSVTSDFNGYKENDLSENIKGNVIGKEVYSGAKFYGHPQVAGEVEVIKEVLLDEPAHLIKEEDNYVLKPGQALIFRANPKAINTDVNFTINYLEE